MATPAAIGKLRTLRPGALRCCLRLAPGDEHLLGEPMGVAQLLVRLQERDLAAEAATLLSYALPEREAVWWSCMCVLHTAPPALAAEQQRALAASQDWVRNPTEERQRQAALSAKEAGYVSAAAFTARAVFASRLVDPASTQAGKRVERAIRRAADWDGAGQTGARLRRFVASGREIAEGGAGRLPAAAAR